MQMKKVSVIMCTYNGEKYLKEQLDSIVNQTYPIHELLIKDDCSTDGTVNIIKEYAEKYPCIRLVENKGREGVNRNFFSAMHLSTGEYIAISDQDDIWELDKLESQVNAIGNKLLCTGISKPFSSEGIAISVDSRKLNYSIFRMIYVGMIPGHTMLIHRDILPLLDKTVNITYDHQIQLVAASKGSIAYVDKVIVNQRRHTAAVTLYKPVDRSMKIGNVVSKIQETFKLYRELKPHMQKRFEVIKRFLQNIPNPSEELKEVIRMAHLQTKKSFISWLELTILCIKKHEYLFHVKETNKLRAICRAAYYPIFCSYYFRYMSKNFKRQ